MTDPAKADEEEKRVITGSEQKAGIAFGSIQPGEVTRTDHRPGNFYYANDPLSHTGTPMVMQINMEEIKILAPRKSKTVDPKKDH